MNAATVTDGSSLAEWRAVRDSLRAALSRVEAINPCCHSCTHFDLGRCRKHDADIPIAFQRTPEACEHWTHDAIPF